MPFKMKYSKEEMSGPKPQVPGLYTVRFEQFKPKASKTKDGETASSSFNLNAEVTIISNSPETNGKKVFASLNSKIPNWIQDFVHSFGLEMQDQSSDSPSFPGIFDADPATFKEDDVTTWKYAGPLVGKTAVWELGVRDYQGKLQQSVRRFVCSVPDCNTRFPDINHAKDMDKKG